MRKKTSILNILKLYCIS